jgi:hypothetical protein
MPGGPQTRKREAALAALLSCRTIKQAAKRAKIGERTLRGWLAEDEFRREYQAARRQALEKAVSQLHGALGQAVRTLKRRLTGGKEADQIRAALGIIDRAMSGAEMLDLAGKVAELETILRKLTDESQKPR